MHLTVLLLKLQDDLMDPHPEGKGVCVVGVYMPSVLPEWKIEACSGFGDVEENAQKCGQLCDSNFVPGLCFVRNSIIVLPLILNYLERCVLEVSGHLP